MSQNEKTSTKEADGVRSTHQDETLTPDTPDHVTTFDRKIKINNGTILGRRDREQQQDEVCSELVDHSNVSVYYGNVQEKSVASITEDNMHMRPCPAVMVPPPPPDPPNPN
ncbi:uncharacterized protein LOC143051370 [Mytilus galloprovincialis]|uniref:uncharacterized protein LOC143051370 n=1 Tax=Mytilus galloprovincialis TaxID=29158 RepID=UPI003F7BABBF